MKLHEYLCTPKGGTWFDYAFSPDRLHLYIAILILLQAVDQNWGNRLCLRDGGHQSETALQDVCGFYLSVATGLKKFPI